MTDEDVFFVCGPDGGARLADEADSSKSGGSDSALKVRLDDHIVTGFRNGHDAVVKVWKVELLIFAGPIWAGARH